MDSTVANVHLVISALVALPLLYAGTTKLLDRSRFRVALAAYHLPVATSDAVVWLIAVTELALGASVLAVPGPAPAMLAALAYLALAFVLERARRLGGSGDCGCFGALRSSIDGRAVARSGAFAAVAAALALARAAGVMSGYDPMRGLTSIIAVAVAAAAVDTALVVRATVKR